MNTEKYNATLEAVEERSYKYDFEIADAFKLINEENELTEEQRNQLESEFIAFRFMTRNGEKRFRPLAEYTNGVVFPDEKKEITPVRLEYWLKRASESKNPVMQARYYDLYYEYGKPANKEELADKMVRSYIASSKSAGEGNEMDIIDSVTRAFLVAKKYKSTSGELFEIARNNVLETIDAFAETNLRWCLDLIELVVTHHNEFTLPQLHAVKALTDRGVAHYQEDGDSFMILESYLKSNHDISQIVNPGEYDAAAATRADAQLYIDEADSRVDSLFIQQQHLLHAEKILRDGGLNVDANKIHDRIEQLAKNPAFSNNFQEFKFEQSIPTEQIEGIKDSFEKARDKGQLMAYAPVFMPSWKESKKSGNADGAGSLTDIFNNIVINDDNMPIARGPESPKVRRTMHFYDASIMISGLILHLSVVSSIENGTFTIDDIMPQLEKIKEFNQETHDSVLLGFQYLFEGKYFEAVSILLPQIEDLMASIMVDMGFGRYRQKDQDLVEYKTLGPILSALKKPYGDDIYHFLHYTLIDEGKENLRNFNGHGKLKANTPNLDKKAIAVLQCYMCILAPIKPIEEEGK